MDSRLDKFIALFNGKDFFEAHEVLEAVWMETGGTDKDFYKGLIQCAVAFVHLDRNNYKGATKLFRTACGYLRHFLPEYEGIDTQDLLRQFEDFFATFVRPDQQLDLDSMNTPHISIVSS